MSTRIAAIASGPQHQTARIVPCYARPVKGEDDAHARIQKLLVTGDNRLKQGVDPEKARASWGTGARARPRGGPARRRSARSSRSGSPNLPPPAARLRIASMRSAWRRPSDSPLSPGRLARGRVRARAAGGLTERAGERVDVERIDEHPPPRAGRTRAARRCASRRRSGRRPCPQAAPARAARSISAGRARTAGEERGNLVVRHAAGERTPRDGRRAARAAHRHRRT